MANFYKKGTLLIPSGPSHDADRMHLHVICTDPDTDGKQLIVSICTKTNAPYDSTCVLQKHEHTFLRHESYVLYRKANITDHAALINGVNANLFVPKDDVNGQVFLRITKGICASPQTSRKIKLYFGCT
jgi:hypothetical protein